MQLTKEASAEVEQAVAFAEAGAVGAGRRSLPLHADGRGAAVNAPAVARKTTYREAIKQAIRDALNGDPRVFLMGEDVGRYGGCYAVTKGLLQEFGEERIRDTPLSESAFVGAGIGAAMAGMRPIVEIMTVNFSLLALDQIVNNAATIPAHVGRAVRGAAGHPHGDRRRAPARGAALAQSRRLVCPHSRPEDRRAGDARGRARDARAARSQDPNPVLIFEHVNLYNMEGELAPEAGPVPLAGAAMRRPGRDLSIVTYGGSLHKCLAAAEQLAAEGVEAEVIDLRSLRPLDDADDHGLAGAHASRLDRRRGLALGRPLRRDLQRASPSRRSTISTRRRPGCAAPRCRSLTPSISRTPPCPRSRRSGPRPWRSRGRKGEAGLSDFVMPSLGADMDKGTVVEWLKKPGDVVARGDILAVVETQKGAFEIEVFEEGALAEILVAVGSEVPVGTVLARIQATGAQPTEPAPARPQPLWCRPHLPQSPRCRPSGLCPCPSLRQRAHGCGSRPSPPAGPPRSASTCGAWPAAGLRARSRWPMSRRRPRWRGPRRAQSSAAASIRRRCARRSRPPWRAPSARFPHYYLSQAIDLGRSMDWLAAENGRRAVDKRLLPAALLLKAVALALRDVPQLNGFWIDGAAKPSQPIHVGWTISLRGGGLLAPAIRDADTLSLDQAMAALRDLVVRARTARIRGSEMMDPTVTVTSLGERGADSVLGVIYPPQLAIVGFGAPRLCPIAVDGELKVRHLVQATLAADHRATDGVLGSRLLAAIDRRLQEPEGL